MYKTKTLKKWALCPVTVAILAASQGSFAHTRLETATVDEGTTVGHSQTGRVLNYVRVGHGCNGPNVTGAATMGTTVIAPNAIEYTPVIGVDSGDGMVYSETEASDYYSPLSNIIALRRGGPWEFSNIIADSNGNKDGFWAGGTPYDQQISTVIPVPFDTNAVTINSESCARSVTFMLHIVDFCSIDVPGETASDDVIQTWSAIPDFEGVPGAPFGPENPYSNYDGYEDSEHTVKGHGWNSPATLKVTRNLETNPLPAGCTGNGGEGDDIYVYPSAAQINKQIPIWSGPQQNGVNYWK